MAAASASAYSDSQHLPVADCINYMLELFYFVFLFKHNLSNVFHKIICR